LLSATVTAPVAVVLQRGTTSPEALMSAPAAALPAVRRDPARSRPLAGAPGPAVVAGPVTVTISVGAGDPDRRARVLAALADLIEAAGPAGASGFPATVGTGSPATVGTGSPATVGAPGGSGTGAGTVGPEADDRPAAGPAPAVAVCLDAGPRTVTRGGRPVELSRREYDLLSFLAGHPRRVFSRTRLLHEVWGGAGPGPRTVDVHVSRLRRKLGAGHAVIDTVRGIGYRLAGDAPVVTIPASASPVQPPVGIPNVS
jgi:DNA-binding winged helix-turn-helix (wHTH) protein